MISGRDFSLADRSDSPRVIIINETMARTLFPGKDAVGQHLANFDEQTAGLDGGRRRRRRTCVS